MYKVYAGEMLIGTMAVVDGGVIANADMADGGYVTEAFLTCESAELWIRTVAAWAL